MEAAAPKMNSPWKIARRFPRNVQVLIAGSLVNRLGSLIALFLTAVLSERLQLGANRTAVLMTAFGAGAFGAALVGGILLDWIGGKKVLIASLVGGGVLALMAGFGFAFTVTVPFLFLLGFIGEMYRPASTGLLLGNLPAADRAVGYAMYRVAANIGLSVGSALGGMLLSMNWRSIFWIDGVTTLLFAAIAIVFVHEVPKEKPADGAIASASVESPATQPKSLVHANLSVIGFLLYLFVYLAHIYLLPVTVMQFAGYSASLLGYLFAINGLIIGIVEVSLVEYLARFNPLRIAFWSTLVGGIVIAATGVWLHWIWFVVGTIIWSFAEAASASFCYTTTVNLAPDRLRGTYTSLAQSAFNICMMVCPAVLLPYSAHHSVVQTWGILIVPTLIASGIWFYLARRAEI